MAKRSKRSLRERLRAIMDPWEPGTGAPRISLAVDVFVLACILASCSLIAIEHLHPRSGEPGIQSMLLMAEIAFTAIFTVEYILRWVAHPQPHWYPFTFYAIIDLLAILPSYIMLGEFMDMGPDFLALRLVRFSRFLRLLRLLRMLKFIRHGNSIYLTLVEIKIWASSVFYTYHLDRLGRLFMWTMLAWILGANAVFVSEKLLAHGSSPYHEYWPSYWNVIVVLVSGMDAERPETLLGMILVGVLLVVGIIAVGMLTGEIVSVLVRSADRRGKLPLKPPGLELEQHFVILGRNAHLENIIRQVLAAVGGLHHIIVVCPDADGLPSVFPPPNRRVMAIAGDPARDEILAEACVETAHRVIVLSSDAADVPVAERDDRALMHALAVAARSRTTPIVLELQDESSGRYAFTLSSAECIARHQFGERLISQAVLHPGATEVYTELMTFTDDSNEFYVVPVPPKLVGKKYRDAQEHFLDRDDEAVILVGLDRSKGPIPYERFWLHPHPVKSVPPPGELVLSEEDRLIVMAYERPSFAGVKEEDLWSGKILVRG